MTLNNLQVSKEEITDYALNEKDALIIYLAGFRNHTKQHLLTKIYNKYSDLEYYHFGDIDVGGFLIFSNLKEKTGIPFIPYKMGINELQNNKERLKKLTENDKKRLLKLAENENLKFSIKLLNI